MKIGTIGYRTPTGLGYQIKSYVKHLDIEKVMVIDLSGHNGIPLNDWYPGAQTVKGYPTRPEIARFLENLDVVLLAETPLNYDLYTMARERGIKTAVVPNWEFFDYFAHPEYPLPDMFISPSMWHYDELSIFSEQNGKKCVYLHHPVDREEFPFVQRTTTKPLHIAGKPAANDRNGTWDFLQAVPDGNVTTQNEEFAKQIRERYRHSNVFTNITDAQFMYRLGDILVMPRRYGGNCLPLNEALSSGMPVIMPDVSPNNYLLPKEWLVPATTTSHFIPRTRVDLYSVDIEALKERVAWVKENIQTQSQIANQIAETISWKTLGPKYKTVLEELVM